MSSRFNVRDLTFSAVIAGFVAVLVGYTSSAAIIFQAAEAAGASSAADSARAAAAVIFFSSFMVFAPLLLRFSRRGAGWAFIVP